MGFPHLNYWGARARAAPQSLRLCSLDRNPQRLIKVAAYDHSENCHIRSATSHRPLFRLAGSFCSAS